VSSLSPWPCSLFKSLRVIHHVLTYFSDKNDNNNTHANNSKEAQWNLLSNRHAIETFVKGTHDGIVRKTELPPKNDQHIQWKGHTIELFAKGTHNGAFCRRGAQWNTLYNGRAMESYEQGPMQEKILATDRDYLSNQLFQQYGCWPFWARQLRYMVLIFHEANLTNGACLWHFCRLVPKAICKELYLKLYIDKWGMFVLLFSANFVRDSRNNLVKQLSW